MNKRSNGKMKYRMLSILGLVIFFGVWEAAVRLGWVSHRSLNAPSEVVETFIYKLTNANPDGSTLPQHFFQSLKLALTSFIIATIIGVPLGWIMGYYKVADFLLNPLFEIIRPIPPIAWIPIVILTMGIGMSAKVFIIFVAAFVPNVINSYLGIRLTDATLINVAKTFGASDWKIFTTVCIPSSMNMVFTGIRLSLNASWTTLVAAEMLASIRGLGYMIQMGRGMKQRVGIARAYASESDILLLDEPFGALDAQTRYQMEDEIIKIWEKNKKTIIFVTNNVEEALYLGDRILLLSSRPAEIKKEYVVDLPRPRSYTDKAFLEYRNEIVDNTDLDI